MESRQHLCDLCGASGRDMKMCTGCYRKFYCSKSCQKKDWIVHKLYCRDTDRKRTNEAKSSTKRKTKHQGKASAQEACNFCAARSKLMCCAGCKNTSYCSKRCQKLDWSTHKQSCKATDGNPTRQLDEHTKISEGSGPTCLKCGSKTSTRKCTGCFLASYCSKRCQEQDWSIHKLICKETVNNSNEKKDVKEETKAPNTDPLEKKPDSSAEAINTGICENCSVAGPIKTCASCKSATYCSRECQRQHWKKHKYDCKNKTEEGVEDVIKTKGFRQHEYERESSFIPPSSNFFGCGPDLLMGLGLSPHQIRAYAERPPGSLVIAKEMASRKFPGRTIIDDFDDMPGEYFLMFRGMNTVLLAFMFKYHEHVIRHGVYLKDKNDAVTHVEFYLDYDNPVPFFSYQDIKPGNYICLENACVHHFMDGTTGIRIDDPSEVHVLFLKNT